MQICCSVTYRVEFKTDPKTKQVTAKLSTLNHTADFGDTAEEVLSNMRELATGVIEVILDEGKEVPPGDTTGKVDSPQSMFMAIATPRLGH